MFCFYEVGVILDPTSNKTHKFVPGTSLPFLMASLVRYGANPILARAAARAAGMYFRNRKYLYRANRLGGIASFMWRNRRTIRRGIKRTRAMLPRTSNKRRRFHGAPTRTPRTQSYYTGLGLPSDTDQTVTLERKTLWSAALQICKAPSTSDNLGAAEGNRIRFNGVKICLNVKNLGTDDCIFHFAIIQPKTEPTVPGFVDGTDFFANPGGGNQGLDRYLNFVDFGTTPAPDQRYNCNGINPALYNVITHKKFMVGKFDNPNTQDKVHFEHYYKFKKPMMFETAGSNLPYKVPNLICWQERQMGNASASNLVQFNITSISYFKTVA